MGLFNFVVEAGAKLFGGSAANAAPSSEALQQSVQTSGLDAAKVQVTFENGKAKVTGEAPTQEEAEKIILAIGNTQGVSQVDSSGLQVRQPAPAAQMYTVRKGDTLWKIAEQHYGKGQGARFTEIVKANSPPIKDPDIIQPGWVLRIPPLTR